MLVAAGCASVALVALALAATLTPATLTHSHLLDNSVTALAWSAVGVVLARHAPGAHILPLVLLVAAVAAGTAAIGTWSTLPVPGAQVAGWVSGWTWLIVTALPLTVVVLQVSRSGPAPAAERAVTAATVAGLLGTCLGVGLATVPRTVDPPTAEPQSPWGLDVLATVGVLGLALTAAAALAIFGHRLRHADPARRSQLAPVAAGAAITVAGIALGAALPAAAPAVQALTTPALPLSVCLAVLHFRLYDSAAVLRRSVVSATLTAAAVVVYAGVVAALTLVVGRTDPGVAITLGLALLVAFLPLQARMRRLITRALYGDRDAPERLMTGLAAQLVGAGDPANAVRRAVADLLPALHVPWAAITVGGITTVQAGRPIVDGSSPVGSAVHRLPLIHLGVTEGDLLVADRSPVDPLDHRDLRFLQATAPPIAAVLASARLHEDMRRSRQALILARAEERRRVRRDLHDDVGPLLSALLTQTDVAMLAFDRSPERTRERLSRIHATGRDALTALRRVAHDLQPPATDDLGLRGALLEVAAALTTPTTQVRIDVDPDLPGTGPPIPAATELAVYRIAGEALGNAVRHAGARTITAAVRADARTIRLRVEDDGNGFRPDAAAPGMGLASMRERAVELGGELDLWSGPHGTVVLATLPLPAAVSPELGA